MTTATHVHLDSPAHPERLHAALMELMAAAPCADVDGAPTSYECDSWADLGLVTLRSTPGQGLPAMVSVRYCPDSPIAAYDGSPQCLLAVSFDTGNGYDWNGAGPWDLHAALLAVLVDMIPGARGSFQCEDSEPMNLHDYALLGDVALGAAALGLVAA